jgi:hypothetical protein
MKWYRARIESNGAWPPDEDSSHMLCMDVVFSVGDRVRNDANGIVNGIRTDLRIYQFTRAYIREMSAEEAMAIQEEQSTPISYEVSYEAEYPSVQDWAVIKRVTDRIMEGTELKRDAFRTHIQQVLARDVFTRNAPRYETGTTPAEPGPDDWGWPE